MDGLPLPRCGCLLHCGMANSLASGVAGRASSNTDQFSRLAAYVRAETLPYRNSLLAFGELALAKGTDLTRSSGSGLTVSADAECSRVYHAETARFTAARLASGMA